MQVAMIAQGEFMELLRAKSDDKKVIFRKLFHTEPYQKIVEELRIRCKGKEKDIGEIRTVCQTEVGHISVPEEYERREEIQELLIRVVDSGRFHAEDMELLLGNYSRCAGVYTGKTAGNTGGRRSGRTGTQSGAGAFKQGRAAAAGISTA
ncbi:MAG: hypothetical protein ACLU3F_00205 [Blautia wexlerae]